MKEGKRANLVTGTRKKSSQRTSQAAKDVRGHLIRREPLPWEGQKGQLMQAGRGKGYQAQDLYSDEFLSRKD